MCAQARAAFRQIRDYCKCGGQPPDVDSLLQCCSVSSDSFGSLPVFDKEGKLLEYKVRCYFTLLADKSFLAQRTIV